MSYSTNSNALQRSFGALSFAYNHTFRPKRPAFAQGLLPGQGGFWLLVAAIVLGIVSLWIYWDVDVTLWKRANFPADSLTAQVFSLITQTGTSGWILGITAVLGLYLSTSRWEEMPRAKRLQRINWYSDANFAFFTIALSGIAANLIKNTIGRARPSQMDSLGAYYFDFAAFESHFASFPSGHSTTSGALGMVLILLFPRYWPIWLVFAILGGVSRVFVGAHYPSDVLAGLAFGAGFVLLAARWLALRGTMFTLGDSWIPQRRR